MNIPLPKNFIYEDIATVKDGILYFHSLLSFNAVMYEIKYAITEDLVCRYCGQKLTRKSASIDHIYPVFLGGPYVPNNFCISCHPCNLEKDILLEEDFKYYSTLSYKAKLRYKAEYKNKVHTELLYKTPVIPDNWYSYEKVDDIIPVHDSKLTKKTMNKARTLYHQYKRIPTPIIVDKNYLLLSGFVWYKVAQQNNLEKVPIIVLENVVLEY